MDPKAHWEAVYRERRPEQVSWFQPEPTLSLELIKSVATPDDAVLDVGGGASTLVDALLRAGFHRITVLDLSATALAHAQRRLGPVAIRATWREADILTADLGSAWVHLWHDRAVFHFLVEPADRLRYLAQVRRVVHPGGHVLIATFAEDGPSRCSGFDVARYSATELHGAFGADFRLLVSRREEHRTPWGARQAFTYCLCRYEPLARAQPAA